MNVVGRVQMGLCRLDIHVFIVTRDSYELRATLLQLLLNFPYAFFRVIKLFRVLRSLCSYFGLVRLDLSCTSLHKGIPLWLLRLAKVPLLFIAFILSVTNGLIWKAIKRALMDYRNWNLIFFLLIRPKLQMRWLINFSVTKIAAHF